MAKLKEEMDVEETERLIARGETARKPTLIGDLGYDLDSRPSSMAFSTLSFSQLPDACSTNRTNRGIGSGDIRLTMTLLQKVLIISVIVIVFVGVIGVAVFCVVWAAKGQSQP
ncbi:uncharacterized protein BXZ73DRAFT_80254 [Epithele typhae]|uniref:uncharacterized protein n=1 Tax=Epithele typhae TaxID=378194 RepID=UPI0020079E5D|nr:uncharacterized protein BXZ73DRAFT_80254 [Epithele typhae]KAH9920025.1 hypothetical protein BXZ73DRAFT_80254 [Epithele typhae]